MSFTATDIVTSMGDVGKPSPAEISAVEKTTITRQALSRFNEDIHNYVLRSAVTISDTQEYTLNVATVYPLEVFVDAAADTLIGSVFTVPEMGYKLLTATQHSSGLSGWEDFTAFVNTIQQLQAWKSISGHEWKFMNGKLYVIPAPTADGDYMMYISVEDWTYATAKDRFRFIFENIYAEIQLLLLATKRSGQAGIGSVGQFVQYPADSLSRLATEYKKKYEQQIAKLQGEQRALIA